jgi:hypothetical protein
MFASAENKDAILAIDRNRGDLFEMPPLRQASPIRNSLISEIAAAKNSCHARILAFLAQDAAPDRPLCRA